VRLAILADLRANEPAFRAVLAQVAQLQVDRVWCIGSLLSYGPDPVAVVDQVQQPPVEGRCLLGHPDGSLLTPGGMPGFNPVARRGFTWAREQLRPRWWSGSKVRRRWAWLTALPSVAEDGDWQFFSGTPQQPEADFLPIFGVPGRKDQVEPHFALVRRGAFVGTIGHPGIIFADDLLWQPIKGSEQQVAVAGRKFIACPGSVGQPRDCDPRASFVVFDGETITWHRVAYDVQETKRRILAHPELSERNGDRLELGR
jgi:diadenosine tetraphosphatase ApaH/serine/threonine PP2A family protein phosphatase